MKRLILFRARKLIRGTNEKAGLLSKIVIYGILIGMGFVYLYPVLYMVSVSFMTSADLVDATVAWIPRSISLEGFSKAVQTLDYWDGLKISLLLSVSAALLQTITLAFAGYGLARFDLPMKKFWFAMIILVFLIPASVTLIPRYMLFNSYKMVGTFWPSLITALGGQGVKSSLFILVYYQFFNSYPKALDEAAMIDGAGSLRVFFKVAIPMAVPAITVAFLFSFIWFWNETLQLSLLSGTSARTLPIRLAAFVDSFYKLYPTNDNTAAGGALNEAIRLSGTLLSILPLLVIYLFLQKTFIQSVERTGITGE